MDSHRSASLILFALLPFLFISSSSAHRNFSVGDKAGWVLNPSESYDQWSARNRFQVNDTLVFKFKEGKDSVFQVTKEDYNSCNRRNPLKRMTSGSSVFQLPQSGPFYFISGKKGSCEKGQKLTVVVLAIRPKSVTQPPTTTSPVSQPPAPIAKPPASAPQPSASPVSPPQSAPVPAHSPSPAPAANSPTLPPSPPPSTTPGSDSQPAPSPDGGVSDINTPAPSTSASWAVSPSSLLILVVSVVVSYVIAISA